jgi:hypothetical protein
MATPNGHQPAATADSLSGDTRRPVSGPFGLIDIDTGNMVGSFASEEAALIAVAETAKEYGPDSDAVQSLSLFRDDLPPEQGFIADGSELVRRALAVAAHSA